MGDPPKMRASNGSPATGSHFHESPDIAPEPSVGSPNASEGQTGTLETPEGSEGSRAASVAELVVELGTALIPKVEERYFAAVAKATLEAAQLLDSQPNAKKEVSKADEVKRKRDERAARVRASHKDPRA